MDRYTVRYRARAAHDQNALVVADGNNMAYIFSGGRLQAFLADGEAGAAAERLAELLARQGSVEPVDDPTVYTLDALARLLADLDPPAPRHR